MISSSVLRGSNVRWLMATRVVRSCIMGILVVIVPLYLAAAGYSVGQVGLLLTVSSAGSVLLVVGVGVLSDRYGRKSVLWAVTALSLVGSLVYGLTTSFVPLVVVSALAGIGRGGGAGSGGNWGAFYPAEQPLIAESVAPRDRSAAFATLSIAGVIGAALGSILAATADLFQSWLHYSPVDSFRPLFFFSVAAGALLLLLIAPLRDTHTAAAPAARRMSRASWKLLLRLWATNSLNGLAMGVLGPFLTYWLALRYHVTSGAIGELYLVVNLMTIGSYVAAPVLARHLGSVRTVVWTRLISALILGALAFAPNFAIASVVYVLRMLFVAVGMPVRQSFVMGVSDEGSRGRVAAIGNLPAQLTSTVAPSIAAELVDSVSIEAPIWMAVIVQVLNGILYALLFGSTRPPEERAPAVRPGAGAAVPEARATADDRPASPLPR